jgi:membrane fusion protein (multidrug efflux system)
MYVRAIVSNAVLDRGLLVPQKGIIRDAKGNASALVVNRDSTVEQRAVQVSRTVGDQWLVSSGLVEGDRVIVEGLQKIHPGVPVVATESATDGAPPATTDDLQPADSRGEPAPAETQTQ